MKIVNACPKFGMKYPTWIYYSFSPACLQFLGFFFPAMAGHDN
jgi:hypothetical protein